jgi:hypothetical protein
MVKKPIPQRNSPGLKKTVRVVKTPSSGLKRTTSGTKKTAFRVVRTTSGLRKVVPVRRPAAKRRVVSRPQVRRPAAVPATAHGLTIVRQAMRHLGEIYAQRDCANFIHEVFTECGLVYPDTPTRYFPPFSYFLQVKTPLTGDIVLYAEHMAIYASNGKIIIADPASQLVQASTVSSFLNFKGYYRWFQDYRR